MTSQLQHELHNMKIGERIAADDTEFMRVPGGWVVAYRHPSEGYVTACAFVEEPLTLHKPKKKPMIATLGGAA